ncbi:DUF4897 domain-containing protein [Thermosipho atlanticus]|uniref:DUF4897 domain-containing protein n=1 Tax=Thermosipho atlanticus DSM 15807 TaxID=1123380 RepID=A0A1M5TZI3_9BACT|nr:DUF4897 domain-containing protein [Thermosipho atlanticus]SHH56026.1 protein of unknown function [Thermosipho atlanticus DSM 15807]
MQNRTLLYILIAFVAIFLIFDVFTLFTKKPKFEITFYQTKVEIDYSENSTITTLAVLSFNKQQDMFNYMESYNNAASSTFIDYFKKISDEIGKQLVVVNYNNKATERAGVLEIEEQAVIKNLVTKKDKYYELSMGKLPINSNNDSEFIIYLPQNTKVISIDPTPTTISNNTLKWNGGALEYFPTVIYTKSF